MNRDSFSKYHPSVSFVFFALVFGFSMFSMHPGCLLVSFAASICYYINLKGTKAAGLLLKGALPLLLLTIIINPAFSHAGETIITYLPSKNPLTLESILYGAYAGILLASVLIWFGCFSIVFTSDKFVYLFGRIIPSLSLLLSMTLRFVPRFISQLESVRQVQKTLGRDTSNGSLLKRTKNAITCFSIVVTWSLENSIDTSDSMKARGYGIGKRTAYSTYRFTKRDKEAMIYLAFSGIFLLAGNASGRLYWRFYPSVRGVLFDTITIVLIIVFALLCFMPVIINRREEREWKRLKSKA